MERSVSWLLVVAGAALILLEVLLGAVSGFDFLLIGSAVLAGGLLGLLTDQYLAGVIAAGVLSLVYVSFGRRRLRARLKRRGLPSNTDALLGQEAVVVVTVGSDQPGRIRHEGEVWRALLDPHECPGVMPLTPGWRVRIRRVDGVTAFVVPISAAAPAKEVRS